MKEIGSTVDHILVVHFFPEVYLNNNLLVFSLLKLDLTVRDDTGHPLDSSSTSTIELFRAHQKAAKKQQKKEVRS